MICTFVAKAKAALQLMGTQRVHALEADLLAVNPVKSEWVALHLNMFDSSRLMKHGSEVKAAKEQGMIVLGAVVSWRAEATVDLTRRVRQDWKVGTGHQGKHLHVHQGLQGVAAQAGGSLLYGIQTYRFAAELVLRVARPFLDIVSISVRKLWQTGKKLCGQQKQASAHDKIVDAQVKCSWSWSQVADILFQMVLSCGKNVSRTYFAYLARHRDAHWDHVYRGRGGKPGLLRSGTPRRWERYVRHRHLEQVGHHNWKQSAQDQDTRASWESILSTIT